MRSHPPYQLRDILTDIPAHRPHEHVRRDGATVGECHLQWHLRTARKSVHHQVCLADDPDELLVRTDDRWVTLLMRGWV
jgi:hypothetical protein